MGVNQLTACWGLTGLQTCPVQNVTGNVFTKESNAFAVALIFPCTYGKELLDRTRYVTFPFYKSSGKAPRKWWAGSCRDNTTVPIVHYTRKVQYVSVMSSSSATFLQTLHPFKATVPPPEFIQQTDHSSSTSSSGQQKYSTKQICPSSFLTRYCRDRKPLLSVLTETLQDKARALVDGLRRDILYLSVTERPAHSHFYIFVITHSDLKSNVSLQTFQLK